ncbi:MAG TPA: FHA domain-containing protein [Bryobacteraceae bacterium]|nr:FHA domain-containing protein [Bryobacteraceae bacterium]
MKLGEYLEKFGRTLFEAPLAQGRPEEPPELAEIRLALLDQVREKIQTLGGRKVFPFDLLRVELRGAEEARQSVFSGQFFRRYLEQEVRSALTAAGCKYPDNLRVEVRATAELPKPEEPWLLVEATSQRPAGVARAAARLIVRQGTANVPEMRLDKVRINIGRVVDVYRSQGIYRRNDLVFAEDTEINRSVSREHAHITYDPTTGEYRLFNDRWYARGGAPVAVPAGELAGPGAWIVRDSMSQEVHRTSRGVKLQSGDEIHLGRAILVFEME